MRKPEEISFSEQQRYKLEGQSNTGDLKQKECVNCFHRICTKVSTAIDFIVNPHITVLILYANYF